MSPTTPTHNPDRNQRAIPTRQHFQIPNFPSLSSLSWPFIRLHVNHLQLLEVQHRPPRPESRTGVANNLSTLAKSAQKRGFQKSNLSIFGWRHYQKLRFARASIPTWRHRKRFFLHPQPCGLLSLKPPPPTFAGFTDSTITSRIPTALPPPQICVQSPIQNAIRPAALACHVAAGGSL